MIKKIIKIGGAAIVSKKHFDELKKIIQSKENNYSVFVISSFGKTTNYLKTLAQFALELDMEQVEPRIQEFIEYFQNLSVNKLNFDIEYLELKNIFLGINLTKELTNKLLDRILSYGEILAFKTILANTDVEQIKHLSALEMIVSNSDYNNAKPNYDKTKLKVMDLINQNKANKYITEGFIAKDELGCITTMGYESSNLTATLLADVLDLEELTIITNVDGIRNYNPEIAANHKLIHNLNYDDALNLSKYGLKLIYPDMIEIAKRKNIKIIFKNITPSEVAEVDTFSEVNNHKSDNSSIMLVSNCIDNSTIQDLIIKDKLNKFNFAFQNYSKDNDDLVCVLLYNINLINIVNHLLCKLDIKNYYFDNYTLKGFRLITSNITFKKDITHFLTFINENNYD